MMNELVLYLSHWINMNLTPETGVPRYSLDSSQVSLDFVFISGKMSCGGTSLAQRSHYICLRVGRDEINSGHYLTHLVQVTREVKACLTLWVKDRSILGEMITQLYPFTQ